MKTLRAALALPFKLAAFFGLCFTVTGIAVTTGFYAIVVLIEGE